MNFTIFLQFSDDWKYVAMVLDRILLWIFGVACVVGKTTTIYLDFHDAVMFLILLIELLQEKSFTRLPKSQRKLNYNAFTYKIILVGFKFYIINLDTLQNSLSNRICSIFFLKGTGGIIFAAPSHYDTRQPIDVKYSKIAHKNAMMKQMMAEDKNI